MMMELDDTTKDNHFEGSKSIGNTSLTEEEIERIAYKIIDIFRDEFPELSKKGWDCTPKSDEWWARRFAYVRRIVSKKGFATTSDVQSDQKLSSDFSNSQQAIRLFQKMNRKEEDIALFKKNPDNQRSPWIITIKDNEKSVKKHFKKERNRGVW